MLNSSSIDLDLPRNEQELTVWLLEYKDIHGSYAMHILGIHAPHPEFVMEDRVTVMSSIMMQIRKWLSTLQYTIPNVTPVHLYIGETNRFEETWVCGVHII